LVRAEAATLWLGLPQRSSRHVAQVVTWIRSPHCRFFDVGSEEQ
jgi:hypothetical protein